MLHTVVVDAIHGGSDELIKWNVYYDGQCIVNAVTARTCVCNIIKRPVV